MKILLTIRSDPDDTRRGRNCHDCKTDTPPGESYVTLSEPPEPTRILCHPCVGRRYAAMMNVLQQQTHPWNEWFSQREKQK